MQTALIDGDIVSYASAASCEKWEKGEMVSLEPEEVALLRADQFMRNILESVGAKDYRNFLSGSNNFRFEVYPEYKANRTQPDPVHRKACKEFLAREWNAEVTDGHEADDAMGINQHDKSVICSIDKDLDMIPGFHYSWPIMRKGEVVREGRIYEVSEIEGLKSFYRSLLVGDRTDNIIGVAGIGKTKAAKLIDPLETETEMFQVVRDLYTDDDRLLMNGRCLWILRKEGAVWEFPV